MAYSEYANAGRCTGKCLYQLSKLGVPLTIVEHVLFDRSGNITYSGEPFTSDMLDAVIENSLHEYPPVLNSC